jgi:hypothetical protein
MQFVIQRDRCKLNQSKHTVFFPPFVLILHGLVDLTTGLTAGLLIAAGGQTGERGGRTRCGALIR